jgi:hypothetical protein
MLPGERGRERKDLLWSGMCTGCVQELYRSCTDAVRAEYSYTIARVWREPCWRLPPAGGNGDKTNTLPGFDTTGMERHTKNVERFTGPMVCRT